MKLLKIFLTFFVFSLMFKQTVFGLSISDYSFSGTLSKNYDIFIKSMSYETDLNKKITILQELSKKIELKSKEKSLSTKNLIILKYLLKRNNENILSLKQKPNTDLQLKTEEEEKQKLKILYNSRNLPDFIVSLIGINVRYIETNTYLEFLDKDSEIKRLNFSSYYSIDINNYGLLKGKDGIISYYNGSYIFIETYDIETKISYLKAKKYFKYYIGDNYGVVEENGDYYGIYYTTYTFLNDKYGFYEKDILALLGTKTTDLVLVKNLDVYGFTKEYTKNKLISKTIISELKNKELFLSNIYDDKRNIGLPTDSYFEKLKIVSKELSKGVTKDDAIKKIYNRVLDNVTYTNPIDLSKKEIFSGIYTYKNRSGICEGYVKLMSYMLSFAGIEDNQVMRGFVINASDFPKIGHAWIKIGDYYYDPTFDDPLGGKKTKIYLEYEYFKLPKDLMYTNRFDLGTIDESLKTKSKDELQKIVDKNLYLLSSKYKDLDYNILKYSKFLLKYSLSYDEKLSVERLKTRIPYYEVATDFSYTKNGKKTYIGSLKFFKISNDNIQIVLYSVGYDLSNKSLLKWNLGNGDFEYRLAEIN